MKPWRIVITVVGLAALAAGVGVLIWWLVDGRHDDTTEILEGTGFGDIQLTAAFARISNKGNMFWLFYPSEASDPESRPLLIWLDGVTGLPPSLLANFAMIGPLDFNLNKRSGAWTEDFNILFVDAPLGTGFSRADNDDSLPKTLNESTDHLMVAIESFYNTHSDYEESPLYIIGQGDGAKLAVSAAIRIANEEVSFTSNLKGVVLGNGVIAPAQNLKQLGFYLSEMGYVDPDGRQVVEEFTSELNSLVDANRLEEAFDKYLQLGDFINEEAGTVAVNLRHLIQKLTTSHMQESDLLNHRHYLRSALQLDLDFEEFMVQRVAPALGVTTGFEQRREAALLAVRSSYMNSEVDMVEYILGNTNLNVTIYNGNLDAVSTTPGQLDWVNNLQWSGMPQFKSGSRLPVVVNRLLHGYFRENERLSFYWINAAGISAPLDSPEAMKRVILRCCSG